MSINKSIVFVLVLAGLLATASKCKNAGQRNTYSHLPADSALYMMWCDELKEDTLNAELYFKRGTYLFGKREYLKALADANKATGIDTTQTSYYLLLGDVCFAVNKTKIAALAYERAVALDNENYPAYQKLGELYYIVKEHEASLKNYEAAIRLNSSCDACYFYKGLNYLEMKNLEKNKDLAISMFQKTIAMNPAYYDAYIQLGEIFDKQNPAIAREYYNAALKLKPNSVEALYHRGFNYQTNLNFDSAGADYKRIIDINPMFTDAYFNVAFMNMQQKKWTQAVEGFKLVVKINPEKAGAWYNLGYCYENSGDLTKAKEAYNRCLNIDPQNEDAVKKIKQLKK